MQENKKWTADRIINIIIYLGGLTLMFLLVYHLRTYLFPFFLALLVAYILDPVVDFIQEKIRIRHRALAVMITLITIIGVLVGIILLISPVIADEYNNAMTIVRDAELGQKIGAIFPDGIENRIKRILGVREWSNLLTEENFEKYGKGIFTVVEGALKGTIGVFSVLFTLVAFFLYLIFLLISFDHLFKPGWQEILPPMYRNRLHGMFKDIEMEMKVYFRGQTIIVLLVAVLFATGFKIIGLPLAIIFGIFVGLLNYVPYLQNFGFIPAAVLGVLQAAKTDQNIGIIYLKILIVFTVVQVIQDAFLTPKIMGDATGLNPAIILLSLSIWGGLFGLVGMVIALPLTSLFLNYYKRFVIDGNSFME